ncbi:hypothetical protein [Rhodococcoides yunnanense]|uniref:hypothetical protein n=1 Tax=Rhodococcoides yunnanense TaxID=278209 RepID=UPI0014727A23|nr:hypothetical protein [Rhodococcus yunnanensis]
MITIGSPAATLKFGSVSVETERIENDTATLFASVASHVIDPADLAHPYIVQFVGTRDDAAQQSEDVQIIISRNGQPVSSFPSHLASRIGLAIIEQGVQGELFADPHMVDNEQLDAFRR